MTVKVLISVSASQDADEPESEPQSEYVLAHDDVENGGRLDLGAPASASAPAASARTAEDPIARRRSREGGGGNPTPPQRPSAAAGAAHPHGWWWEDPDRSIVHQLFHYVRYRPWQKKVLTVLVVVTSLVVFADLFGLFWQDGFVHRAIQWFLEWMDRNRTWAVLAFVGAFVLTTLVFVPPSLLIFGAGVVFTDVYGLYVGIALAMAACFAGSAIGAVVAFVRARYMMRDLVKLFSRRYPLIRAVDRGLKSNGFRVMLLLRLCSLIPFSALNYIGGVTGVRWGAFVLSLVGLLPSLLLTVILGATAGSLAGGNQNTEITEEQRIANIVWMSVLGGCGLLAVVMTVYFARKELKKEMEREALQAEVSSRQQGSSADAKPRADEERSGAEGRSIEASYEEGVDDEEWFWVWA